ncbi:phosphonate ABC transporter ATP-binding protein [Paenibacillus turpanensis]|uniref:phosphonate ABC transporter ATP-binding protein n=1 Tax=Paenibacillus turpanensis TaxID=2689078 RepID=UPI00140DE78A|nr:phosphonate ABC transporter ATP-binding protein [Paenibacillus turpanensis]
MDLVLQDITVQYDDRYAPPALQDVQLTLQDGQFVVILGPSGAGKSTLIRCMNQLVRPTRGKVFWGTHELTALTEKQLRPYRAGIGMVFQQFHLVPRCSVLTNVLTGLIGSRPAWKNAVGWFDGSERERAGHALEQVGLAGFERRRVDRLSGGQQQRVAIAKMMMQRPLLILGDEPVASLDPATARGIMELLTALHRREKRLTVVNLHNVELAKQYATRIIGMNRGRIVFDGPPEQLTDEVEKEIYRES